MTAPAEPSRSQVRREREREQARALILSAARDIARAEGWDAVTMRRLADEIGYSANYAYRYFSGREGILLAWVKDGYLRLARMMREAGPSVHAAAGAYLDFGLDEPELYQVMYGLGGVHVPAASTVAEGDAVGAVIGGLLGIDDPDDDRIVRLWATVHGLLALHGAGKLPVERERLHRILDPVVAPPSEGGGAR